VAAVSPVTTKRDASPTRPASRRSWSWLGLVPFFLFSLLFLLLPVAFLVIGSLQNAKGALTAQNYVDVLTVPKIVNDFQLSIEISLVTAIGGVILGFFLAYAVILGGLPAFLRDTLMTFCGVASNFAGVPLAMAFIFTLGQTGLVTLFLRDTFHFGLYQNGFSLYTKLGLEIVYMYFQFPLMVLIIAPAIDGLKKEWREAAENLGATSVGYWRRVALPILMPSLLGAGILLFGNAFGAQATAYQLTGGLLPLITIDISNQISGDVLHNVGLGYAMAVGMVVIMSLAIGGYLLLQRKTARWMR
jgi:putative spermidine/putrescine transport system permease protein